MVVGDAGIRAKVPLNEALQIHFVPNNPVAVVLRLWMNVVACTLPLQ